MKTYTNPVIETDKQGVGYTADPYVLNWNGKYYHCYRGADGVYISESNELCDIGKAQGVKVYATPSSGPDSDWYAPELHRICDAWYIYGSPCTNDKGNHCMTVLEYKGESPLGQYVNKGMVRGLENTWTLDGTILEHEGTHYFIWSPGQELKIAKLENPWSIVDEGITLTKPEYEFEIRDGIICEGPAILKRGKKIHIAYSVNNSKGDYYCLGLLTFSGGNIMDAQSWEKTKHSVFEGTKDILGPGHCSFTTVCEDGNCIDYIVYHANFESKSGWFGRSVWIQPFTFDENDMPQFGEPHR